MTSLNDQLITALNQENIGSVNINTVEELLKQGADPNNRTQLGVPVIYYTAYKYYSPTLARLLIKHGAKIHYRVPPTKPGGRSQHRTLLHQLLERYQRKKKENKIDEKNFFEFIKLFTENHGKLTYREVWL